MAEPLRDVRTKINAETWALLEAESRANGREQAEVIREILHNWSAEKWRVIRVARDLLKSTGQEGA